MTARDRIVIVVVLAAALLAGVWFTQIAPKRETLKTLDADIASQQKRLEQARATEGQAAAAKKRYDSDYATVARLGKAVPVDDSVPSLVYQLESAAQDAKVDFRSLKLNASAGGAPVPAPAPAASGTAKAPAPAASGTAKAPAPAASGTAKAGTPAATQAATATLPPGASVGPAGFPTMPFTFVFDGSFFSMEKFLRNLDGFTRVRGEQLSVSGRLLSIDGFSLTASRAGFPTVKATLAATAYLLPADEGLTAGATPAGPTPAAATGTGAGATASTTAPTTTGTG